MLNHSFGVYIRHGFGTSYGFGVSNPAYQMLNYLSINSSVSTVEGILLNLSKVLNGAEEEFGWGADLCIIISRKAHSTVRYYEFDKTNWYDYPLYIEIPTAWFIPAMRDWRQFLALNPQERYLNTQNKALYATFALEPIRKEATADIRYYLRVNHPDYEMDLFNPLVAYNRFPKIDEVLQNLSQVLEKKQESYVWGQPKLKLTSYATQTEMEYSLAKDATICLKTIPTEWLMNLMKDWRLFMELNPKSAYLDKPKARQGKKSK